MTFRNPVVKVYRNLRLVILLGDKLREPFRLGCGWDAFFCVLIYPLYCVIAELSLIVG
jgi:hypothetical protein